MSRITITNGLARVVFNGPSLNALSLRHDVVAGLLQDLREASASNDVELIVVSGSGQCFCVGSDIGDFEEAPEKVDELRELLEFVAHSRKPIVMAMHGMAFGADLELAMAADARVATPEAQFCLPQVTLGLLPGGGGTQRLPRLVGVEQALELMLEGHPIGAERAQAIGLIDLVVEDIDKLDWPVLEAGLTLRKTDALPVIRDDRAIARARAMLAARRVPSSAHEAIVDCIVVAASSSLTEGLRMEAERFRRLMVSEVSLGLRHACLVSKRSAQLPARLADFPAQPEVCNGFVGNRLFEEYLRQAYFLVEEGALPQQVDKALEDWGMTMGPIRTMDLTGQDIAWAMRKRKAVSEPLTPHSFLPDMVYKMGRFGQKTGSGFYLYPDGSTPQVDPEIDALVIAHSAKVGVERRVIADEEIVERCIFALVNEGASLLDKAIVSRPLDIDAVYLDGYGFPQERGGPMFYADRCGLPAIVARMKEYAKGRHGWSWGPAPLLERLVTQRRGFFSLNGERP
ncbi:enoyl-CoA hydratase-related protein [Pseudomonas sp. H11T01]|uniref:enoyl-CoA hydratase/isomerase family protein n=1 Tax=Pseudomonas sp. H11T01 TaxID=3402749 RepID=UPI003AD4EA2C